MTTHLELIEKGLRCPACIAFCKDVCDAGQWDNLSFEIALSHALMHGPNSGFPVPVCDMIQGMKDWDNWTLTAMSGTPEEAH